MNRWKSWLSQFGKIINNRRGASTVEYVIILAAVALI
ncbi:hypothetical protein SAMN05444487_107148 [Marininema mesophilum]|uniref:Uncharacterized protein n=1 Tax=Marininema mesophilum TaxID=1048340 RepID=A0A1H2XCK6_9BACL|nr:hypothetical protein SAMN05444487_107148 [Marininema mesophilum]